MLSVTMLKALVVLPLLVDSRPQPCSRADIFFVAHPDDDLIFQSPSLLQSLRDSSGSTSSAQHCSTTIYLTAGDAGLAWASGYPLQREYGARAAYAAMLGADNPDAPTTGYLHRQIFYTLPDGGADRAGYPAHNHTSLSMLYEGDIGRIWSVTGSGRAWTLGSLKAAVLSHLRSASAPRAGLTVHLQDWMQPNALEGPRGDHSDHVVGAKIVRDVLVENEREFGGVTVVRHLGYETQWLQANVPDADLTPKMDAFFAYARHDSQLSCREERRCREAGDVYLTWLQREYKFSCHVADLDNGTGCSSSQQDAGSHDTETQR